jgi:hypothetical protein
VSSLDDDIDATCAPLDITTEQDRTAAVVMAGHARNATELREWLEMTGLAPWASPFGKKKRGGYTPP